MTAENTPPEPPPTHLDAIPSYLARFDFRIMLVTLFVYLLATAIIHDAAGAELGPFGTGMTLVADAILLAGAAHIASAHGLPVAAALGAFLITFGLSIGSRYLGSPPLLFGSRLCWIFLLGYACTQSLRQLFTARTVTFNMISASLFGYAIVGVVWALIYSNIQMIDADAFNATLAIGTGNADESMNALYYSFVTMLTLGYGDIVPVSPTARAFAIVETFFGQVMIVVLVARLVGLHVSQAQSGGTLPS